MEIGISGTALVARADVGAVCEHARAAADDGFTSYSIAEHPTGGFDALTVLALVAREVPGIGLASAVIPTFPRHPMVLAGQARTVANVSGGRFTLGVGLSHAVMMADLGIPFDKPIRHLREYLSILLPLLRSGSVDFEGDSLQASATFFASPPAIEVPVLVAALGPQALKVAGTLADGTTLAWVGPKTIRHHIVPSIREAAAGAGRADPQVVASLPIAVTDAPDVIRAAISERSAMYGGLPSYRAMFDREGVENPGEVAIVGSKGQVADALADLAEAGVTTFVASEVGSAAEREQTRAFLRACQETGTRD